MVTIASLGYVRGVAGTKIRGVTSGISSRIGGSLGSASLGGVLSVPRYGFASHSDPAPSSQRKGTARKPIWFRIV